MGVSTIRVAVIGAGALAREHLRAFKDIDGVELVGICSRTLSKAQIHADEFKVPVVTTDLAELDDKARPDLVVVAVTIPSTLPVSLECFEYDWTTLIEKPLGVNLAAAEQLARVAREKKRKAYVAFNRRYYASMNWVKKGLDSIESKRFIKIQDQEDTNVAAQDGHAKEVLDNWMFANSIHLIDLFRYFGRSPISKITPLKPWPGIDSDVLEFLATIDYENGDSALYEGIWNAQGPWAVTVTTNDKRYEMKPVESAFYQNQIDRTVFPMEPDSLDEKYKPGFYRQAIDAVKATRGENNDLATLDDALETTRLTHRLFGLDAG